MTAKQAALTIGFTTEQQWWTAEPMIEMSRDRLLHMEAMGKRERQFFLSVYVKQHFFSYL